MVPLPVTTASTSSLAPPFSNPNRRVIDTSPPLSVEAEILHFVLSLRAKDAELRAQRQNLIQQLHQVDKEITDNQSELNRYEDLARRNEILLPPYAAANSLPVRPFLPDPRPSTSTAAVTPRPRVTLSEYRGRNAPDPAAGGDAPTQNR